MLRSKPFLVEVIVLTVSMERIENMSQSIWSLKGGKCASFFFRRAAHGSALTFDLLEKYQVRRHSPIDGSLALLFQISRHLGDSVGRLSDM